MKFTSINYAVIKCLECGALTEIQPSKPFAKLNCECKKTPKETVEIKVEDEFCSLTVEQIMEKYTSSMISAKAKSLNIKTKNRLAVEVIKEIIAKCKN